MTLPVNDYNFISQNFSYGGNNLKTAITSLQDNESPFSLNFTLGKVFGIDSRNGYERITSMTGPVTGIYQLKKSDGTIYNLSTSNSDINLISGTTYTAIFTGRNPTAFNDFASINDYAAIVNGVDQNLKYDGTFYAIGVPSPGASLLPVLGAAGVLTGAYSYRYVFVNMDGEESNPSSQSITVNPAAQQVNLSSIAVSGAPSVGAQQIVARRVYRTESGGTTFYLLTEIADNTTTVFVDNIPDDELGIELEFDNNYPPILTIVESHKDRLFGVDPNYPSNLLFSKRYRQDQWPILNSIPISVGDGDVITAIVSFFDQLVIFKRKSIYVLSGDDNINFTVQKSQTDDRIGSLNNRVTAVIGNKLFFLSERGVYSFDGLRINYESEKIEPFFNSANTGTSLGFNWTHERYSCGINYKNATKNWYFLCVPTSTSPKNDFVLVYDTVINAWSFFDGIYVNALAVVEEGNRPNLWTGDQGGRLWRQDRTHSDGYVHTAALTTGPNTSNTLTDTNLAIRIANSTGIGAATLTDTTFAGVALNQYANYQIYINNGVGIGQFRTIISNTASPVTFTLDSPWTIPPVPGDEYILGGLPVNGVDGVRVKIVRGLGENQIRTIVSNTPIQITVDSNWTTIPDVTSRYSIGFITKEYNTKWTNYNDPAKYKRLLYEQLNLSKTNNQNSILEVYTFFDFSEGQSGTWFRRDISLARGAPLWNVSIWNLTNWNEYVYRNDRTRAESGHIHMYIKLKLYNDVGNEPVTINSLSLQWQLKGYR